MRQLISLLISIIFFSSCNSIEKITNVQEKWYELLPDCPCRNPDFDSIRNNDGWAREKRREEMSGIKKLLIGKKDFTKFHPGASAGFRSYPHVITTINGKKYKSGQQCMYDEQGNLIKQGAAAGTPDKISPARGESRKGILRVNIFRVYAHVRRDANPWKNEGWEKYNKLWPPNQGVNCK